MKEGYSKKSLVDIVGPENLRYLHDLMNHPGWEVMKLVNKEVKADWINQTANLDLSSKTDEEMIRTLRLRNGMIRGVDMFMHYLEVKKQESINKTEKEKQTLQDGKNTL